MKQLEDRQVVSLLSVVSVVLAIIASLGLITMSVWEWNTGTTCPKIAGVPICYLMTPFTILVVLSQLIDYALSKLIFWIGLLVPWTISLGATLLHLNGLAECPHLGSYPVCYLALGLFSTLILFNRVRKNYLQE